MLRCFLLHAKLLFHFTQASSDATFFTADVLSINKEERGAVRRKGLTILGRDFKEDYTASAPSTLQRHSISKPS